MKKILLTIAIIIGITLGATAQGLFGYGAESGDYTANRDSESGFIGLALPSEHGLKDDVAAPLGGGALLLVGFGAAYLVGKKRKQVR